MIQSQNDVLQLRLNEEWKPGYLKRIQRFVLEHTVELDEPKVEAIEAIIEPNRVIYRTKGLFAI